jgi:hypothetical protein
MPRLARLLLVVLLLGVALAALPARAQIRIEPIPPHVKPQWTLVPNSPGVYYAPNIPTDVFRYRGKYYFFWGGYLYQGKKATGPWKSVTDVPAWFYQIDPAYFKTAQKEGAPATPTPPLTPMPPPVPEIKGPGETPETPQPTPAPAPTPAPEKGGAPPTPEGDAPKVM